MVTVKAKESKLKLWGESTDWFGFWVQHATSDHKQASDQQALHMALHLSIANINKVWLNIVVMLSDVPKWWMLFQASPNAATFNLSPVLLAVVTRTFTAHIDTRFSVILVKNPLFGSVHINGGSIASCSSSAYFDLKCSLLYTTGKHHLRNGIHFTRTTAIGVRPNDNWWARITNADQWKTLLRHLAIVNI